MAKVGYKKLLCNFEVYRHERIKYKLPYHVKCQMCGKKFELNAGLFTNKDEKIICKECYKNVSKGIL